MDFSWKCLDVEDCRLGLCLGWLRLVNIIATGKYGTINHSSNSQPVPFSALVGRREGHPAWKTLGVGGDNLTGVLHVL